MARYDLLCTKCGQAEGQWLLYFTRYHGFVERRRLESIVDADVLCNHCREEYRRVEDPIYTNRPNWLDFKEFTYVYTPAKQQQKIAFLLSRKCWQENFLNNSHWKKKIWHLWYYWKGESNLNQRREMLSNHVIATD